MLSRGPAPFTELVRASRANTQGDRHVYASRTRFIAGGLLGLFDRTSWPPVAVGAPARGASQGVRINVGVRNPKQSGHRFRRKAATDSDRKRSANPNEGGHPVDRVRQGALSAI
jgi:hypothetical protein